MIDKSAAMWNAKETDYGWFYWPANKYAVECCDKQKRLPLTDKQMREVWNEYRHITMNGNHLPFPGERVEVVA